MRLVKIILLGAAGSGKGTQAELISKTFRLPHISTGELCRKAIENGGELGKEVERHVNNGILVPDEIMFQLLKKRFAEKDAQKGFVLDGFPRTESQAKELSQITKIDKVIYIEVDFKKLMTRLISRRMCESCGKNFDVRTISDKHKCKECGGKLIKRDDDHKAAINKRFETFKTQTKLLIDFYKRQEKLTRIDGDMEITAVFEQILRELKQ